jgi:hypothetical protein
MDEAVTSVATPGFDSPQVHRAILLKAEGMAGRWFAFLGQDNQRPLGGIPVGLLTEIDCDVEETVDIHE